MKKHIIALLAAALVLPFAASAADTSNLTVSANVVGTCKFTATPDAAFGTLDPAVGSDVTATSAVQFWCTKNAAYTLAVGNGANFNTGSATRQLRGPAATDLIPYSITPQSSTGQGLGRTSPVTVTLTGSVLGANYVNASVGAYSDVVQLTIAP